MIYQFDTMQELFSVTDKCKSGWRWMLDGTRVLASLEPKETVGWVVAENVPADTRTWLERR